MAKIISYIFFSILFLLTLGFALLNSQKMTINYYLGSLSMPLSLLLFFVLLAGFILGLAISFYVYLQQKYQQKKLSKKIKLLEQEITNLRALPVQDMKSKFL